jgi:hypothetical protein
MNNILLESYIKSVITQNQIKALHVFDFDMTLYNHDKDAWIKKVILDLQKSLKDPSVRVILCTARSNKEKDIEETEYLMKKNDMSLQDFDDCYFKSINRKESTPEYKSNVILDEVSANKGIKEVKFWDDRADTLEKTGRDLEKHNKKIKYIPVKVSV